MFIKKLTASILLAIFGLTTIFTGVCSADSYNSYIYNEWDESKPAPQAYKPVNTFSGIDLGIDPLNGAQDMYVDASQHIYIADSGNNRIVVLDKDFRQLDIIDKVLNKGKEEPLENPKGIYVSPEKLIYIAEEGNDRVLVINEKKEVRLVISNPKHPLIPQDLSFKPIKIAADTAGKIYVLSFGCFYGLMQFDPNGEFIGYYGSNKVEVTPAVIVESFWKNILTKSQRASMARILPIEYSNLDYGKDGFIYTSTIRAENSTNEIKRLNPLGNNSLLGTGKREINFGDLEVNYVQTQKIDSSFVDLKVDPDGYIFGLDQTRGRIFEYDYEGNLISVFGGLGNQKGTFAQPVAVEYLNGQLLVLDAAKNNITVFKSTEYEQLVRKAINLYRDGKYEEAMEPWKEAARKSISNNLAYIGIGKALMKEGKKEEALKYFKLGSDRYDYSKNFAEIRLEFIRNNASWFVLSILFAVATFYTAKAIIRKKNIRNKNVKAVRK